jgi:hypothetical protein
MRHDPAPMSNEASRGDAAQAERDERLIAAVDQLA